MGASLSARRAWIEIVLVGFTFDFLVSLSARRAWIEMADAAPAKHTGRVALRKESVDRNPDTATHCARAARRSPQGERG